MTSGLREVGALGLAGPRARLSGLARAVVAQLAALHSPDALEIVLISTDRARTLAERTAEWSWLGWLPHLRPGHGQDCRLLLAYDREQATARTDELLRRLEDHAMDTRGAGRPSGTSGAYGASGRRAPGIGAQRGSTEGRSSLSGSASQQGSADGQLGSSTARHTVDDRDRRGTSGLSSSPATYNTTDEAHHHRSGTSDHPTPGPLAPYAADDPASGATRPRASDTRHPGTAPAHSGHSGHSGHSADDTADALRGAAHRPAWARDDEGDADGFVGPYTVLVVDGDPGGADVREAVARLAHDGPRAGIHVVCLAETEPASPASPVTDTYEAACAAAPTFRECGAVALLSGDVATALRLLRVAHGGTGGTRPGTARSGAAEVTYPGTGTGRPGTDASRPDTGPASPRSESSGPGASDVEPTGPGPVGNGTIAAVDAVSLAWAERFARALAPLRADGPRTSGTRVCPLRCPSRRACWTSWGWPGPPRRRCWRVGRTPVTTRTRWAGGPGRCSGLGRAGRSPRTSPPKDRIC